MLAEAKAKIVTLKIAVVDAGAEVLIDDKSIGTSPVPPEVYVEPGRSIVGPAGVALYRVGSIKDIPGVRRYVCVDGGMADNIRPPLYNARYEAALANRRGGQESTVTIAGKYCESGDVLIKDARIAEPKPGDLIAVPASGANCLAMASNYNMALRPAVVMVRDGETVIMQRRERYEDLLTRDVALQEDRNRISW
jgi:diaminopimelate decarboxylase